MGALSTPVSSVMLTNPAVVAGGALCAQPSLDPISPGWAVAQDVPDGSLDFSGEHMRCCWGNVGVAVAWVALQKGLKELGKYL